MEGRNRRGPTSIVGTFITSDCSKKKPLPKNLGAAFLLYIISLGGFPIIAFD
jgi:hypothetical protein